jgi:hypothetical protein
MAEVDKAARREAKDLFEASRSAFTAGNYREVRRIDLMAAQRAPGTDVAQDAERERESLGHDRTVFYIAGGVTLLYVLAWVYALA